MKEKKSETEKREQRKQRGLWQRRHRLSVVEREELFQLNRKYGTYTGPFTSKELHDRIKRQLQPFPSLLQSAEDERRQALNAADQVEQHGAAESFSEWLDKRRDSI